MASKKQIVELLKNSNGEISLKELYNQLTGSKPGIRSVIYNLIKKGVVKKIKRGVYVYINGGV